MSTNQIAQARHLGTDSSGQHHTARRAAQRRLLQLTKMGVLRRIEQPVYRGDRSGSKPYLYALGAGGAEIVGAELGVDRRDIAWQPSSAERNFIFMDHILSIVDYRLALEQACHSHGVILETFIPDRILRRDPVKVMLGEDESTSKSVAIIPDAFYVLRLPGQPEKVARCLLEIDRGTTTITPRFWDQRGHRQKVKAYLALAESTQLQEYFETESLWVKFVTTTQQRLQSLIEATVLAGGDHRFWFTSIDQLGQDVLNDPIWQVAGRQAEWHTVL